MTCTSSTCSRNLTTKPSPRQRSVWTGCAEGCTHFTVTQTPSRSSVTPTKNTRSADWNISGWYQQFRRLWLSGRALLTRSISDSGKPIVYVPVYKKACAQSDTDIHWRVVFTWKTSHLLPVHESVSYHSLWSYLLNCPLAKQLSCSVLFNHNHGCYTGLLYLFELLKYGACNKYLRLFSSEQEVCVSQGTCG